MIELLQVPYSPFCIVQRRILEFSRALFKLVNVPNGDRSRIWKATQQRYYQVPVLRDGKKVVFETGDDTQVIAKYLDAKLKLELFPREWAGVQDILWRYIENDVESFTFKLNDIYAQSFVPKSDWMFFLRHKERKFGRGCLAQWGAHQQEMIAHLAERLELFEEMLSTRPFLLGGAPLFVDFDLFGILGNFLYTGNYEIPHKLARLRDWHRTMKIIQR